MVLLVKLLAIGIIIHGCFLMLRPENLQRMIPWAKEGNRLLVLSGAKAIAGALLMLAASRCRIEGIVLVLGVITFFSGVAGFMLKKEGMIKILEWAEKRSPHDVRVLGTVALAFGVLLALAV
jgi:uncharacterized membrane protein